MKDPRDVIIQPVVSEKSYDLIDRNNTYTFVVDRRARKEEIRRAVEVLFDVRVLRVNTLNRKGKRKRTRFTMGKRADTKRAMVTLPIGQTVDIFGM